MNSLFDLFVKIGADDSGFKQAVDNSTKHTEGLGAKAVAMGQIIADAFETAMAKAVEFGKAVVDVGMEQETALAKVSTIMNTDVKNGGMALEDMSDGIRELSSEMGISVAEMSDAVYNAISATGDTAGALGMAEQASKLATAGFTDTSSALSTLTTAMNAYGDKAGSVEHISDSLIKVQNLGVTTVAELSSSMGKAIASASAYGVDLENLESAYISITKAGINTAEGTTYISSMMKELGDEGSQVSGILQEVSGKSFNELMQEGASLGDVLEILSESVGNDSTALMNLWSSAEAGKASSAIMGQGIEAFNKNLKELQNTTGETETAYAVMADTMEHKTAVFKENIANKMADIFTSIQPILEKLMTVFEEKVMPILDLAVEKFTEFAPVIAEKIEPAIDNLVVAFEENVVPAIKTFADFVQNNVIPVVQWLVENLDTIVPIVAGVVAGFMAFKTVSAVMTGIPALITAIQGAFTLLSTTLMANPIGIVIGLLVGLGVALVTLYQKNESFRNAVQALWTLFTAFLGAQIEKIKTLFTVTIPTAIDKMIQWFAQIPSKVSTALINVIAKITQFVSNLKNKLVEGARGAIESFVGFFKEIPSKMADIGKNIIEGLWGGISGGWDWLKGKVGEVASSLLTSAKDALGIHSPSKEFRKIGQFCVDGFNEGFAELANGDVFDGMKASLKDMDVESIGGTYGGYTQVINVNQQISTADELARVMRTESRYGLMRGVALG